MNIKWDADKYTSSFSFVHQYGSGAAALIDRTAGAAALDLGCGNGALTKALAEDGLAAFGMDASPDLLQIARATYPELTFREGDATDFTLEAPVDIVFSNAVFHWIAREDQPRLLNCVHRALKDGGQFVFEFGGHGNNRLIHQALAEEFQRRGLIYRMPFYFPTIGEYAVLLEAAGFQVRFAALFDRMTELQGENGLADWIELFVKTPFASVPEEEKREIVEAAAGSLRRELYRDGKWYADYVRLRMKALRL